MADLKKELNSGKISKIRPFGEELQHGLRLQDTFRVCTLGGRRLLLSATCNGKEKSVLDRYFEDITVEWIESQEEGWNRIKDRPMLWK
jgi:hypothetical protein